MKKYLFSEIGSRKDVNFIGHLNELVIIVIRAQMRREVMGIEVYSFTENNVSY